MTNENNHIYKELLDRIIEEQKDLYGELAVKTASNVKELEISANGKVIKILLSPKDAIRKLLCEYEVLGGKISIACIEPIIKAYRKNYPDLILPED